MAKRYSGQLSISLTYVDRTGEYSVTVSGGGERWRGNIRPSRDFPLAVDSPKAFDEIARAAIAFADTEKRGLGDLADYNAEGTGVVVRRTK